MESGDDLSSRAVTSQVLSTRRSLTSVFGMGTGGTFSPLSPENEVRCAADCFHFVLDYSGLSSAFVFALRTFKTSYCPLRSESLRSLTFVSDQALDRLVLTSSRITAFTPSTYQPCCLQGVLPAFAVGYFFSRGASRLDAFSVYPVRTSLPCYAVGTTTVAPEVRPFRSSRTRNSSSHVSYAHDG